jgi:hypothetical protein
MAPQLDASKPGRPLSPTVGTSGSSGERAAVEMASAFSLPPRTWPSTAAIVSNITSTRPAIRSGWAALLPR